VKNGTQLESGDEFFEGGSQILPIVSLTTSESLAPIFATNLSGITDLPAGSNFAGYQIELQNFFDDLTITDVFYTGSLVVGNASNLNFTGSGVEVTASGSNGVLINITGGGGGSNTSGTSGQVHQVHQVLQESGSSGSSGTSGESGSSGSSGTSGESGSSGSSGTSGADGSSGSSGTSGQTELQAHQVLQENRAHQVHQVLQVKLEHQVHQALQEFQV
jgi:hypothetical protein